MYFSSNHTDAELQSSPLFTKRNPIAHLCCILQAYYILLPLFLLEVFLQCTLIMFFTHSNSSHILRTSLPTQLYVLLSLNKNKQLKKNHLSSITVATMCLLFHRSPTYVYLIKQFFDVFFQLCFHCLVWYVTQKILTKSKNDYKHCCI